MLSSGIVYFFFFLTIQRVLGAFSGDSGGFKYVRGSSRMFQELFGGISESFRALSVGFRSVTRRFMSVLKGFEE